MTSTTLSSSSAELATIDVTWSETGCVLEFSGRVTRQLLDHARDLVYAQPKPHNRLTVRFRDAVLTRDLVGTLIAARRYLALSGCELEIDDPDARLAPLTRNAQLRGQGNAEARSDQANALRDRG